MLTLCKHCAFLKKEKISVLYNTLSNVYEVKFMK